MASLDLKDFSRNRCVGWISQAQAKAAGMKDVTTAGKGIYSNELTDDSGNVNAERCALFNIDPADVRSITVDDLPKEYGTSAKAALAAYVAEWNVGVKDASEHITADELVWRLILNARMQDEANETVKRHRPVTDKAKERAFSTIVKALKSKGKSDAEIAAALEALS